LTFKQDNTADCPVVSLQIIVDNVLMHCYNTHILNKQEHSMKNITIRAELTDAFLTYETTVELMLAVENIIVACERAAVVAAMANLEAKLQLTAE
jgi:hypothetical protein